jgi:hypothetical protein
MNDLEWLRKNPGLQEMMDRYPSLWEEAGRTLVEALEQRDARRLGELATRAKAETVQWEERIRKSRRNPRVVETALPHVVRGRMLLSALDKCFLASATGVASGRIKFNLLNGIIVDRLLFKEGLTRKAASLAWFRLLWPLVSQKRILMPLVQPKGIFCFYSRRFVGELARLIGGRKCLEIAAGDGTLSRLLGEAGVNVTATDDYSWSHVIRFPESVVRMDAKQALVKFSPQVVVCSWPPPGNSFERSVFSTRNVELYVVIGSRYPFASGNWRDYSAQQNFEWAPDNRLSGYVLPPELETSVLLFIKKGVRS